MHYTAGVILSVVFQLAHVVEDTHNPIPDEKVKLKILGQFINYLQQLTLLKNWLVNYYTGGLNHQIEHHIFPNISHIHYDKIGEIVKQTAKECELPYFEFKTTRQAILSHFRHLKELGKQPQLA
jgi:linoleoyl-CoA desaturase